MKNKLNALIVALTTILVRIEMLPAYAISIRDDGFSLDKPIEVSDFEGFFKRFKEVGIIICGICTLTSLIFFIISLTKLSVSAGNERGRADALKGVLFSGASLVVFGGASTIIGIFWNAI